MARYASEAERMRAHRKAFQRALAEGITPAEAQAAIDHEAAMERHRQAAARLAAKMAAPEPRQFENWGAPHMLRD